MDTLPVTLIVKAPNQQIEDQTVKCELSWTIQKLKQHLSEVYPSKPAKHEQKLIYSGQLLNDSVTLKDVLRQYEGQDFYTVHLVCTSKDTKNQQSHPVLQTATTNNVPNTVDVTNTPTQTEVPSPNISEQNIPNTQPNMPNFNGGPMDPYQYYMHLAMTNHAYYEYMNYVMQANAAAWLPRPNPNDSEPAAVQPNPPEQPAAAPEPAPVPRDPENQERDWLDVFYKLSRAMILFSVVYFYSSPIRFLLVLLIGSVLYLYQIGFFRNINNNNNNNNNNGPQDPAVPEEEQGPSRLMIVWIFFTTFFTSLIPEIPSAI